jgi:SAM-dependent methyltransferase
MVSLLSHPTPLSNAHLVRPMMTTNAYDSTKADQWEVYRSYRPQYPTSLFQRIYTYHVINGGSFDGTAHDAGCGPGVTAAILSLQFKHVVCSDYSQSAIDAAHMNLLGSAQVPCKGATNANFTFKVSSAEDMSWIAPSSIDMVTMSEALHWTDTSRTIAAAAHVLKPGGTFATWYYTQPRLPDNSVADGIFRDLQSHWCKLRRDFSEQSERTLWVEQSGYDCVEFSSDLWEDVQRIKINTGGGNDVWVRDWDLAHMRLGSKVGPLDRIEFLEDVKDWQQDVNLDWFRGWFESLSPKVDSIRLDDMLEAMDAALGPQGSTRAVWPVVVLLASKSS